MEIKEDLWRHTYNEAESALFDAKNYRDVKLPARKSSVYKAILDLGECEQKYCFKGGHQKKQCL
jgi:hypothetical protein